MRTGRRIRRVRYEAPLPVGVEVMTLARLREMAPPGYLRAPQRPVFHLLILGTSGHGTHTVDFTEYPVEPGGAVWVRPGQVQRFSEGPRAGADLILFEADFLIPGTAAAALADRPLGPVAYTTSKTQRGPLEAARVALSEEYADAVAAPRLQDASRTETLRHLLSVLILRLAATAMDASGSPDGAATGDASDLHARFRDLLERDFAAAHDVDHYGRELGYSRRSLARATQAAVGRTPKELIQDRLALEAARLLAHSNLPVGAIAAALGFRDPSNFSTFFAAQTGLPPTAFRRRQREPARDDG